MKWSIKIDLDGGSCHIELETGWFSNKWRRSLPSTVNIGTVDNGTWKYDPALLCGKPSGFAGIKLFQHKGQLVGTLYTEKYPIKVDDRGDAEINISVPPVPKANAFWWAQS